MGINVLSLFDGMSCGQIALKKLGIEVDSYFASEIDPYGIQVTKDNFPATIHLGDVNNWRDWDLPKIDLVIGGSPCQGFSFAGQQLNFDDPRSKLFFVFHELLTELAPTFFLLENVKMVKKSEEVITQHMGVAPILINSRLVSAQNRERLYWTNIPAVKQPEDRGILLKDVLEQDVPESFYHTEKGIDYMNRTVKGGRSHWDFAHHSDDSQDKSRCLPANLFKGVPYNVLVCGAVRGRRLDPETGKRRDGDKTIPYTQRFEPREDGRCGTLTTAEKDNLLGVVQTPRGKNRGGLKAQEGKTPCLSANSWEQNNKIIRGEVVRKFMPVECERLQTVPDGYTKCVSNTQRYKMLGNGWTVDVVAHILNNMKLFL